MNMDINTSDTSEEKKNEQFSSTYSNKNKREGILKSHTGDENIPDIGGEINESIEKIAIPNSPFIAVGNKEIGYWASIGIFRLCEKKETIKEVIDEMEQKGWETIINVICAIIHGRDMELAKKANEKQFNKEKI